MVVPMKQRIERYLTLLQSISQKDTWDQIEPCDILLIRHDHNCGFFFKDRAYAQIIDSFGEQCEIKGLKINSIATPFARYTGKKATFSPLSCNRIMFFYTIFGKILSIITGKKYSNNWSNSKKIDIWSKILERGKPRYVIGIQPDKNVCIACKGEGIPVFDLQHGVFSDEDEYYGSKFHTIFSRSEVPDGFLCWDTESASIIQNWAAKENIQVYTVGNPWFQRFLYPRFNDALVNQARTDIGEITDKRPRILVSLQGGLSDKYSDISDNIMNRSLRKVIQNTENTYSWHLRLHPIQMYGYERISTITYLRKTFGNQKTHQWVQESSIALPVILDQTDLHITHHSSVVIEAAWMGIRSAIISECVRDGEKYDALFLRERKQGLAELVRNDPESIQQWISATLIRGRGDIINLDYRENLDQFIERLKTKTNMN